MLNELFRETERSGLSVGSTLFNVDLDGGTETRGLVGQVPVPVFNCVEIACMVWFAVFSSVVRLFFCAAI